MNYKNINLDMIVFSNPKKNDDIYISFIKYKFNDVIKDFQIMTSKLKIYDIYKVDTLTKLEIEFLINYSEFYECIYDIDNHILNKIINHGEEWFGHKLKYDTIYNMFNRTINPPERTLSFPKMVLSISSDCKIIDKNDIQISIEELKKNNCIEIILNLDKVCFYSDHCNLTYIAKKIKICDNFCQTYRYMFSDSDNSEMNYIDT